MSVPTVTANRGDLHPSNWGTPHTQDPTGRLPVPGATRTDEALPRTLLTILVKADGDNLLVLLGGELDPSTAPQLHLVLADVVANARTTRARPGLVVILDVTRLTFLGAAGLTVFVEAHQELAAIGAHLRVTGADGMVRRVLDITGLSPRFCSDDRSLAGASTTPAPAPGPNPEPV